MMYFDRSKTSTPFLPPFLSFLKNVLGRGRGGGANPTIDHDPDIENVSLWRKCWKGSVLRSYLPFPPRRFWPHPYWTNIRGGLQRNDEQKSSPHSCNHFQGIHPLSIGRAYVQIRPFHPYPIRFSHFMHNINQPMLSAETRRSEYTRL